LSSPILITTNIDSLQNGRVGDFLIIGAGGVDIYICPKEQFLSTYAKHISGKYRYIKKRNVLARQLNGRLRLQNNNGWETGDTGDYCVADMDKSNTWIVLKEPFEENYVEVSAARRGPPRWIFGAFLILLHYATNLGVLFWNGK